MNDAIIVGAVCFFVGLCLGLIIFLAGYDLGKRVHIINEAKTRLEKSIEILKEKIRNIKNQ